MNSKPKLAFLLSDHLGWQTYGNQLVAAASRRDEFEAVVHRYRIPRAISPFLLWEMSHQGGLQGLRPRFDPLVVLPLFLSGWQKAVAADPAVRAVHVGSHMLAGHSSSSHGLPYTVALDVTRLAAEKEFTPVGWSAGMIRREAELCRRAAHVFPMSRWISDTLVEDYEVAKSRITVLPPSAEPERFVRARHEQRSGALNLLFVGNNVERKGLLRLIDWVRGPLAGKYKLHVVSSEIPANDADPAITFHGRVDNMRLVTDLFPRMDAFCLPSRLDMSPQVLMEAAFTGLPSVVSDIAGLPELVLDGTTGFVCPVDDDTAFVDRLAQLADRADLRRAMGHAARDHAEKSMNSATNFDCLFDTMLQVGR